jgi:hypothetical protein
MVRVSTSSNQTLPFPAPQRPQPSPTPAASRLFWVPQSLILFFILCSSIHQSSRPRIKINMYSPRFSFQNTPTKPPSTSIFPANNDSSRNFHSQPGQSFQLTFDGFGNSQDGANSGDISGQTSITGFPTQPLLAQSHHLALSLINIISVYKPG